MTIDLVGAVCRNLIVLRRTADPISAVRRDGKIDR